MNHNMNGGAGGGKIRPQINITVDQSGDEEQIVPIKDGTEFIRVENTPQNRSDNTVSRMM